MFNRLLSTAESGISKLQTLQKTFDESFETPGPESGPSAPIAPPDELVTTTIESSNEVDNLRKQVSLLTSELQDKTKQITKLTATNTNLLTEGRNLSKRLGNFEAKVKSTQRELEKAEKKLVLLQSPTPPEPSTLQTQLDQSNEYVLRLENERVELHATQASLIKELQGLNSLYVET